MPAEIVAAATETITSRTPGARETPELGTGANTDPIDTDLIDTDLIDTDPIDTDLIASDLIASDAEIVDQFLHDFLQLLDERTERIQELIDHGDHEAAAVALLSLETSSQMADAADLVHATRALRYAVEARADDVDRCLEMMTATAERTKTEQRRD